MFNAAPHLCLPLGRDRRQLDIIFLVEPSPCLRMGRMPVVPEGGQRVLLLIIHLHLLLSRQRVKVVPHSHLLRCLVLLVPKLVMPC